jgi:hypothetical protein
MRIIKSVIKARISGAALLLTMRTRTTRTACTWTWRKKSRSRRSKGIGISSLLMMRTRTEAGTRTMIRTRTTTKRTRSRRTKGTAEGAGHAEPSTPSVANSPTTHMIAMTTNLTEGVVGVGVVVGAGVRAGAGAVGESLRLALMCRTTVTTAATRDKLGLSVDEDEDGGVAEGVVEGVVEPPLLCVGVGGVNVVELLLRCAVVGDVGVVERSFQCEAGGDVGGVVLDDHYHRSINVRQNERPNERVCVRGGETLTQIPPRGPIAPFLGFPAPLGSTSRTPLAGRASQGYRGEPGL